MPPEASVKSVPLELGHPILSGVTDADAEAEAEAEAEVEAGAEVELDETTIFSPLSLSAAPPPPAVLVTV